MKQNQTLLTGLRLMITLLSLCAIASIHAQDRKPAFKHFLAMGAIAGLPTIAGAWIGGFSYSPAAATFFLALGAGAIIQVIIEVGKMVQRSWPRGLFTPLNAAGLILGIVIMYGTALMVVA